MAILELNKGLAASAWALVCCDRVAVGPARVWGLGAVAGGQDTPGGFWGLGGPGVLTGPPGFWGF